MRKWVCVLLFLACLYGGTEGRAAQPSVSAQSAVVMDAASGRILYDKNMEKRSGMASTTKIMTAIVALENGDPEDVVCVSAAAAGVEGSSMYLSEGEEITLNDLLYGLMLVSGNDAAAAIAEHIGGSTEGFAAMMNEKAKEIGAENTHFDNPHGLASETHYTTAKDLALIASYGLKNKSFAEIAATKSKKVPWQGKPYQRQMTNHNKLLNMYDGCIGVKTGFTKATGRCLVSAVQRGGMTLVCVTLNAPDDWNDHIRLYEDAFARYRAYPLFTAGQTLGEVAVKGGVQEYVKIVAPSDCCFPAAEEEADRLRPVLELPDSLNAPVRTGQAVGRAGAELDGVRYLPFQGAADVDVPRRNLIPGEGAAGLAENLRRVFYQWLTVFCDSGNDL